MPRNGCLTSARYSMICDIISPTDGGGPKPDAAGDQGHWEWKQDEESGAIVQEWVRDNPDTVEIEGVVIKDVPLFAEGIVDGGIRVAGTTETFRDEYVAVDWVRAQFPPNVLITRRDRVANIRDKRTGLIQWREDEMYGRPDTMFNVQGVTPVHFMGKHVENHVLLERTEVQ